MVLLLISILLINDSLPMLSLSCVPGFLGSVLCGFLGIGPAGIPCGPVGAQLQICPHLLYPEFCQMWSLNSAVLVWAMGHHSGTSFPSFVTLPGSENTEPCPALNLNKTI